MRPAPPPDLRAVGTAAAGWGAEVRGGGGEPAEGRGGGGVGFGSGGGAGSIRLVGEAPPTVGEVARVGAATCTVGVTEGRAPPGRVGVSTCRTVGIVPVRVRARRSSASSRPDW